MAAADVLHPRRRRLLRRIAPELTPEQALGLRWSTGKVVAFDEATHRVELAMPSGRHLGLDARGSWHEISPAA